MICDQKCGRSDFISLIDAVLLPMKRRIRLDDDALVRALFEFFDQRRLERLQCLGNLRKAPQPALV
jgi:hypothetical protein